MAIPDGYPFSLNDDDLDEALEAMMTDIRAWPSFDTILPELKLAIIQAGLEERARRETAELRRLTKEAAESAGSSSRRALLVSVTALVVAAGSLIVPLID